MSAGKKKQVLQKRCKAEETHICTGCNYPFLLGPIRGVGSCGNNCVNGTCSWLDHTNRKHGCQEVHITKSKHMNASTKSSTVPNPVCCEELLFLLYLDHIDKKPQFHVLHCFLQKWVAKYKRVLYFCLCLYLQMTMEETVSRYIRQLQTKHRHSKEWLGARGKEPGAKQSHKSPIIPPII